MKIADFGVNRKGETSKLYTLENGGGMEIAVSDFGATLHSLMVLDRRGIKRDVVLGYDSHQNMKALPGLFSEQLWGEMPTVSAALLSV